MSKSTVQIVREVEQNAPGLVDSAMSLYESWGFGTTHIAGATTRFRMAVRVGCNRNRNECARREAIYRLSLALDHERKIFRGVTGLETIGL